MISELAFFPTRTNPLQSSAMSGMNLALPQWPNAWYWEEKENAWYWEEKEKSVCGGGGK